MASTIVLARMIIFLSLATFLLSSTSVKATLNPKLVQDVCKESGVYDFCVRVLGSNCKVSGSKNDEVLLFTKSALSLAISNAANTQAHIYKLLKSRNTKPQLRQPLKTCAEWYENVINSLKAASAELQTDAMTANYDAQIAGDGVDVCEKVLSSNSVQVQSVSERNKVMKKFVSIGFSVTDYLIKSTNASR